jgi:hypothetical protein
MNAKLSTCRYGSRQGYQRMDTAAVVEYGNKQMLQNLSSYEIVAYWHHAYCFERQKHACTLFCVQEA